MPAFRTLCFSLLIVFSGTAVADEASDRALFKSTYATLKAGKTADISSLKDYILYPYLEYQNLTNNLSGTSTKTLTQFLRDNSDSPLSKDLQVSLMQRYNVEGQWGETFTEYQGLNDSIKARCLHLQARIELGDKQKALEEGKTIWMSGRDRPKQCDALFAQLKSNGQLKREDYWARIKLAIDRGATSLAKSISRPLSKSDQRLVKLWITARSKPQSALSSKLMNKDTPRTREVAAYAIKRLARNDTESARDEFQNALKKYKFSIPQQAEISRYIAVRDALDHEDHALTSLSAIPEEYRDTDANNWLARLAVRQGNWRVLLEAIEAMPAEQREESSWQYWKARALEAEKQPEAAKAIYQEVAKNASFYGFLSADQLGQPYTSLDRTTPALDHLIPGLLTVPGIQRALELLALDMKTEARAEWFHVLEGRNKEQMLAAAKLAQDRGYHFTAILTISRAKDWNEVGLRFPMAYESIIRQTAAKQGVPASLIYGVARRESAFDPNIVSSAKAQGLMQLIPPTAKQVAKELGLKRLSTRQVFEPETNVLLGASYLKSLLKRFDGNYALATASYNAGPHRMPRWAPDYPLEAARWIESIPYNETRNYVQAVMSYMVIYEYKLNGPGQPVTRLSERLAPIKP
jgi:soluble lytic murein transglycosylase